MAVTAVWCGALTDTTCRVRGKVAGASARLAVATDAALTSPTYTAAETPDAFGWVDFTASGLAASTEYWYAIEDAGVLDTTTTGQFTTAGALSYTFAASSCAGDLDNINGISNHAVFDTIRNLSPLFFSHLGDLHYKNITVNDPALYRDGIDDVLAQSRQHQLYRTVPLEYVWDDHDYANNNSDRLDPGRPAAAQVFRERVPSDPLPDSAGIGVWRAKKLGRVLHIWSDCRSYRDPSTDPASSAKTMLGLEQKAWMADVLATSDAEAFVWHNPTPWMGLAQDTWAGYTHERDELVAMFEQYGWLGRMICLNGDYHGLAMDSGGGNEWGGFPVAIFGSMDSANEGGAGTNQYDQGVTSVGPNRYGTVTVADDGDTMDITLRAFIGSELHFTTTLHIVVTPPVDPEEPPPPAPPVVQSVAIPATRVTWYGCDLVSGRIIAELPDVTGTVSRILGAYTSSGLTLPIPLAGPGALGDTAFRATVPGQTMIVAVVNQVPTWAGIVLTRTGGSGATLQLGCVSLEGYLNRRYVTDHEWNTRDEVSVIAQGLAYDAIPQGIGLMIDAPATGVFRDRTYKGTDDATVYQRLRELMGVIDGPEWTIDVDWEDDEARNVVRKTLRVRKRIGVAAATPSAVFETTASAVFGTQSASDATYRYTEDYTDGKGANHVIAYASGEGETRPQSVPQTRIEPGWPRYERRFSPSSSITVIDTLNDHAASDLARLVYGSRTFEIEARWDVTPRLNLDWRLGDDVAWQLVGHRHPAGITGQGRVIGWELDIAASVVRPILWEAPDAAEGGA